MGAKPITRLNECPCPHHQYVMCVEFWKCKRCGWNPEEERRRKLKLRKKYGESNGDKK